MRLSLLLLCGLAASPAFAQKDFFFGSGVAPVFKEQEIDKRFRKSRLGKALEQGTLPEHPGCVQLVGGLLTVLAEIGPTIHKKDENFTLDPTLIDAVNLQLSTPAFPAMSYVVAMVRRVRIDGRLPDAWLATAQATNPTVKIIDVGKLKFLNETYAPIDSFLFSIPAIKGRYVEEVVQANSAVTSDVAATFRDTYLDRDVAWGGVTLVDAGAKKAQKKKGKKAAPSMEELIAILQWLPPDPAQKELVFTHKLEKPPPIQVFARLAPKQYVDLERIPRGKRMLVKGRFWEMNRTVDELEVRDALLFEDRDWSRGVLLADPNAVAQCPLAVNDLTGVAPQQPGGFKH